MVFPSYRERFFTMSVKLATKLDFEVPVAHRFSGPELFRRWLDGNKEASKTWALPRTKTVHGLFITDSSPLSLIGADGILGQSPWTIAKLSLPGGVISDYMNASAIMSLEHHGPSLLGWFPTAHIGQLVPDVSTLERMGGYNELCRLYKIRDEMFEKLVNNPVVTRRLADGLAVIKGYICPDTGDIKVLRLITKDVSLTGEEANERAWAHVPDITHGQQGLDVLSSVLLDNYMAQCHGIDETALATVVNLSCMDPRIGWRALLGDFGFPFVNLRNPGSALTAANIEAILFAIRQRGARLLLLTTHDGTCAMHKHALGPKSHTTPLLTAAYHDRDNNWQRLLHNPHIASRLENGDLVAAHLDLDLHTGKLSVIELNCSQRNMEQLRDLRPALHCVK